jgi:small-conductance mechanosensitive channel
VVTSVPRVIADPAPSALLSDFGADGIDLTVSFWIQDPENGLGGVRSDVNLAVLDLLNARRVQIPFPQRVVHMQPNVQPARRAEIAIDD